MSAHWFFGSRNVQRQLSYIYSRTKMLAAALPYNTSEMRISVFLYLLFFSAMRGIYSEAQ